MIQGFVSISVFVVRLANSDNISQNKRVARQQVAVLELRHTHASNFILFLIFDFIFSIFLIFIVIFYILSTHTHAYICYLIMAVCAEQLLTPAFDLHTFFSNYLYFVFVFATHLMQCLLQRTFLLLLALAVTAAGAYQRISPACARTHKHKSHTVGSTLFNVVVVVVCFLISYYLFTFLCAIQQLLKRVCFVCFSIFVVVAVVFFFLFCFQRYQSIDALAGYSAVDSNSLKVYFLLLLWPI